MNTDERDAALESEFGHCVRERRWREGWKTEGREEGESRKRDNSLKKKRRLLN